jgi:hypothetical protein
MFKKIKSNILLLSSLLTLLVPTLAPVAIASADSSPCTGTANSIATGASAAANTGGTGANSNANPVTCGTPDTSTTGIQSLAGHIVNIFSIIVGIVSIIMIIYGGFRYITSGGDSNAVGGAKNTLIYAIVGLIIVALAQVLVHFVLSTTSTVTG